MSRSKKCLKCGHTAAFDSAPPMACPACGAVYSKVEAAISTGAIAGRPTTPNPLPRPYRATAVVTPRADPAFIDTLRAESNYPNFRSLVGLATWFFYLVAIGVMLSALFGSGEIGSVRIGIIFGAVVMIVVVTAAKEASLMLADLSDAAVYTASRHEST